MKIQALFIPADKESFQNRVREELLPLLYQMPYIDKIELTPFSDTPDELQEQFIDKPIYYQIALYLKEEDILKTFSTEAGKEISSYLRSLGAQVITSIGDNRVFYRWDLEQLKI
ncbi:hypothetical protein [Shimazuella kribbensis]|uniref:hypothetical protein n=1 Tax=Shimazuella kribbensis TaxID=139808 RepID=UPI00041A18DF|nr:hypothetical protein [Shimazuella kribbensis]